MEIACVLETPAADKIARHLASGRYDSPEDVVRAALEALDTVDAEMQELRRLLAEGDADIAAGRLHDVADAGELLALVRNAGEHS